MEYVAHLSLPVAALNSNNSIAYSKYRVLWNAIRKPYD
jgi:hypothetical protein